MSEVVDAASNQPRQPPQQPELSPLQKFANRTPEEKAKAFLVFSQLLKDELEMLQRKPN